MAPTLTEPVKVKIPPGSKADSKLRLKGKGLPTATGGRAISFSKLKVVMPTAISDEERALRTIEPRSPQRSARRDPRRIQTQFILSILTEAGRP